MLPLFFHNLVFRIVHSNGLRIRHGNIMLGILLSHFGDFLKLQIYQYLVRHFLVETILEFVSHYHVHIVGWESTLAKLDGLFVVENVSRQRCCLPLPSLLLLAEALICLARCDQTHVIQFFLLLFFQLHLFVSWCFG